MNAKFKQVPAELIVLKCKQSVLLAARRGGSYRAVAPPAPHGDEGLQRWFPGAGRTTGRAPGSPTASLRQSPKWRPHRHRPLGVGGSPPAVTLPRSPQRYPTAARLLLVLLKLTPPGCKLRQ